MTRAVIYAISPLHIIAQFAALRHAHPDEDVRVHLVIHWPHAADDVLNDLARVMTTMTASFQSIEKTTVLSQKTIDLILSEQSEELRYDKLSSCLGDSGFDEIYYAHDVGGFAYQLLAGANPKALRITTGENFGHVFERKVYFDYLRMPEPPLSLLSRIRKCLRRSDIVQDAPKEPVVSDFRPHRAMLLLPVDQSGSYLNGIDLIVPPKHLAREITNECITNCAELKAYVHEVLSRLGTEKTYVICTQNFAECGTIDVDQDIAMWCEVIRANCEPGSRVLVKTHPAESIPRVSEIASRLGDDYKVAELDKRFCRYPIELWAALVVHASVVSGSMPLLSLKYLYDIDCVQAYSDDVFERWFPENVWRFYKNGLSLFTLPLSNYPTWNGESVLWPRAGSLGLSRIIQPLMWPKK